MKTIPIDSVVVEIITNVHCFFQNEKKTAFWMNTKNLNFGGVSPIEMINRGRGKKLLAWILGQLDENRPLTARDSVRETK